MNEKLAEAIDRNFTSPNVPDSNLEASNIVDALDRLATAILQSAHSAQRTSDPLASAIERLAMAIEGLAERE